jgi:hypothetical protein
MTLGGLHPVSTPAETPATAGDMRRRPDQRSEGRGCLQTATEAR